MSPLADPRTPLIGRATELSRLARRVAEDGRATIGAERPGAGWGCTRLVQELIAAGGAAPVVWVDARSEVHWAASLLEAAHQLALPERDLRRKGDALVGLRTWLRRNDSWLLIIRDGDVSDEALPELLDDVRHGSIIRLEPPLPEIAERSPKTLRPRGADGPATNSTSARDSATDSGDAAPTERAPSGKTPAAVRLGPLSPSAFTELLIAQGTPKEIAERTGPLDGRPLTAMLAAELLRRAGSRASEELQQLLGQLHETTRQPLPVLCSLLLRYGDQGGPESRRRLDALLLCADRRPLPGPLLSMAGSDRHAPIASETSRVPRRLAAGGAAPGGHERADLEEAPLGGLLCRSPRGGWEWRSDIQSAIRKCREVRAEDQAEAVECLLAAVGDANSNGLQRAPRGTNVAARREPAEEAADDALGIVAAAVHLAAAEERLSSGAGQPRQPADASRASDELQARLAAAALAVGASGKAVHTSRNLVRRRLEHKASPDMLRDGLLALGRASQFHERFGLAARAFRRALELGPSPEDAIAAQLSLAEIHLHQLQGDQAARRINDAVLRIQALSADAPRGVLRGRCEMLAGAVLLLRGSAAEARTRFERAIVRFHRELPEDDPDVLQCRVWLAKALTEQQDHPALLKLLEADDVIRRQSPRLTLGESVVAAGYLAELHHVLGRFHEAEPCLERLLEVRRLTLPVGHRLVGEAAARLAVLRAQRGAFRDSEPLFKEALGIYEEVYGSEHPELARVLNHLAESLFAQGQHDSSRRLFDRALAIQERTLRRSDPQLARTRNNLAAVYVARGKFAEAEDLYRRDLEAKRRSLPAQHPAIATTLNNLGDVCRSLTRYSEAEAALREALAIRERTFGGGHPQVAQSLSNLGYLLMQLHRFDEAGRAFERALHIREFTLSAQHPHLATTLECLGRVRAAQGDWRAARDLFQRSMEIARAVYGDKHPQFACALTTVGRAAFHTGSPAIAELQLLKARSLLAETVGPNHRLFAEVLLGLAELQTAQQRLEDAFPLLERALAIQKGTMAAERLETADTLLMIVDNLLARNLPHEARERLDEVVSLRRRLLGEGHDETLAARMRLAEVRRRAGSPGEAVEQLQSVMRSLESLSPRRDDLESELLGELSEALAAMHRFEEAEALLERRLALVSANADDSGEAADLTPTLQRLAHLRLQQGRGGEAAPLLWTCLRRTEQQFGAEHAETLAAAETLARLLCAQGQVAEAGPLLNRIAAGYEKRFAENPARLAEAFQEMARMIPPGAPAPEALAVRTKAEQFQDRVGHVLDDLF